MSWWDFLSDFISILNQIFNIPLFSVYLGEEINGSTTISLTVGGLLVSLFMVCTIFFYLIPRR